MLTRVFMRKAHGTITCFIFAGTWYRGGEQGKNMVHFWLFFGRSLLYAFLVKIHGSQTIVGGKQCPKNGKNITIIIIRL